MIKLKSLSVLFFSALLFLGLSAPIQAKTVPPGGTWGTAGLGFGAKLESPIGGSDYFLMLLGGVEHSINSNFSVVGDIEWGLAGTIPFRMHAGVRIRITGLKLPLSPWLQTQLTAGVLFDALGADLGLIGIRPGLGADYFITSKLSTSVVINLDIDRTLGERPAFYGQWEFLLAANYLF